MSLKQHLHTLITLAQQGDRDAMGQLIQREMPWVRALIAGYIGSSDQVDDICQDTFVSVWRAIGSLKKKDRFKPWLYRIAINKVRSFLRANARQKTVSLPSNFTGQATDDVADRFDKTELLKKALRKMDARYRDPLIVHYLQGKSCDETAHILGLKPATARIRLLRGREKLGQLLKKEEMP